MTQEKIFKVSEFNEFINLYLGGVGEVIVEGEISEIKVSQNRWLFAKLKDEEASVDVFAIVYQISGYSLLEPGMLVHVYGNPRLYKKTGRFSIFASSIVPAGEGALKLAFERLKEKLEKEGLFDPERKRAIPQLPERIGLITAKGSRAYGDFIKVLSERMGGLKIYFYPIAVQGKDSASSIIQAFNYFNESNLDLDLIALVRGGGSLEDLQSFNDEQVARAIFSSRFPVVCGIGHEDDITIADLVADVRASTPTNAAGLIVRQRREVLKEILLWTKVIENKFKQILAERNKVVFNYINISNNAMKDKVIYFANNIGRFNLQFVIFSNKVSDLINKTIIRKQALCRLISLNLDKKMFAISSLMRVLKNLDYTTVLKRGFSITLDTKGKVVKSILNIKKEDRVTTRLFDGKINSKVFEVIKNHG